MTSLLSAVAFAAVAACGQTPHQTESRASSVEAMKVFDARLGSYLEVRGAVRPLSPLDHIVDLSEAWEARERDAASLRAARAGVHDGNVFTPAVASMFHSLIGLATRGRDIDQWLAVQVDDEADLVSGVDIHANGRMPEGTSNAFPVALLFCLPSLPTEIEYRILHHDLVVLDVDLNVVIDVLPHAFETRAPSTR